MSMENDGGMMLKGKNQTTRRKIFPVPLGPPQIAHGFIRVRTRDSAVRGRRLTASAMARA
jgi:hypothetical protein